MLFGDCLHLAAVQAQTHCQGKKTKNFFFLELLVRGRKQKTPGGKLRLFRAKQNPGTSIKQLKRNSSVRFNSTVWYPTRR